MINLIKNSIIKVNLNEFMCGKKLNQMKINVNCKFSFFVRIEVESI